MKKTPDGAAKSSTEQRQFGDKTATPASFGRSAASLIATTRVIKRWGTSTHVTAPGIGAEGERLTGRVLDKLPGYVVLHDRKIPGREASSATLRSGPAGSS